MNKPIKFKNGNRLQAGQLHMMGDGRGYRHVGSDIARRSDGNELPASPIKPGMRRVTSGPLHPWLHGQALADGGTPEKTDSKAVPPHDSVNHSFGQPRTAKPLDHGAKHLRAAGRLSARDKAASPEPFDESFIGHAISPTASLPAAKRRLDK